MEPDIFQKFFDAIDSFANAIRDPEQTPFAVDPSTTYARPRSKPRYYHRDGKPILSDELMPDFMKWAMLFEHSNRTVKQNRTLYGERLSTVYLGMDHSFFDGPPLIFETMLFAPRDREEQREYLRSFANQEMTPEKKAAYEKMEAYIDEHYPHDQLQLRYTWEDDARERHLTLWLQCLIPPRWRRFLFYTIGRDEAWQ